MPPGEAPLCRQPLSPSPRPPVPASSARPSGRGAKAGVRQETRLRRPLPRARSRPGLCKRGRARHGRGLCKHRGSVRTDGPRPLHRLCFSISHPVASARRPFLRQLRAGRPPPADPLPSPRHGPLSVCAGGCGIDCRVGFPPRGCALQSAEPGPGRVAPLVRASSRSSKVVGSIPGRGMYKKQSVKQSVSVSRSGTTNRCLSLSFCPYFSLSNQ